MIRNVILGVVVLALLGACSVPTRTGPPAPIVSAPAPGQGTAPASATNAPRDGEAEAASVYPYEAPSTVAEAPAGMPDGEPEDTATAADTSPASEAADSADTSTEDETQVAYAPDQAETPSLSPAAEGLMREAEQQRQSRDYPGAAASLERALRISPQSAYLWNRLARVRLEQGLYSQAQNLAARSNALAGEEASLKRDNWSVIAVARRRTGDIVGATEAERYARGG